MTDDDDYFEHARREMFPKMAESSIVVSLMTGQPDPKLCMELGAALLFDKPILLVTIGDRFTIPERVRRLAAGEIHLEDDELLSEGSGADRLAAAVNDMLGRG